jgi:uncharacterized membrane protein YcaP (DUF421 family)
MKDVKIIEDAFFLKVTKDELRGKLREANVLQLNQVKAVVLETTRDISLLHSSEDL